MGRFAYHHGDLAQALVDEATSQVRVQGSDRVTLRGVAQAVGVSPSAAYNHFADKDALLAAVAAAGHRELDRRMVAASMAEDGDDDAAVVRRLRRLAGAYVAFAREDPHVFRHAFGPLCAVVGGDASATDGSQAYRLLELTLDELDERGLLRPGARVGLDLALWSMVHGFAGLALDGMVPWEAEGGLLDVIGQTMLSESALALPA